MIVSKTTVDLEFLLFEILKFLNNYIYWVDKKYFSIYKVFLYT
jgi:hypothetical protein